MSIEANEVEENLHEEQAAPAEQDDPFGFGEYFETRLSREISKFGEITDRGKEALKKLYDGRSEAEAMWRGVEIDSAERNRMKSDIAHEVNEEYEDLWGEDAAFTEGVAIIVDETG